MRTKVYHIGPRAATRTTILAGRKSAGPSRGRRSRPDRGSRPERRSPLASRSLWIAAAVCVALMALTWTRAKGSGPNNPDSRSTIRAGAVPVFLETHDPSSARQGGAQPEGTPPASEEILIN